MMDAAQFLPILHYLSGPGAGLLASWVFDQARAALPLQPQPVTNPLARLGLLLLWGPRYARLTVMALAALIGIGASVAAAYTSHEDASLALAAAIAVICSQLAHSLQLSASLPAPLEDSGPPPAAAPEKSAAPEAKA